MDHYLMIKKDHFPSGVTKITKPEKIFITSGKKAVWETIFKPLVRIGSNTYEIGNDNNAYYPFSYTNQEEQEKIKTNLDSLSIPYSIVY